MGYPFVAGYGYPKMIERVISFPFFIDAGLLTALVYHGYNGIRVVFFDLEKINHFRFGSDNWPKGRKLW